MAKIYRMNERKKIKFDDVTISFKPLSNQEKSELAAKAGNITNAGEMLKLSYDALKKSVKQVEGIEYADGESFQLKFDENKELTEECLEELMTLPMSTEMLAVSQTLIHNFGTDKFLGVDEKSLKGVSVLGNDEAGKKKNK